MAIDRTDHDYGDDIPRVSPRFGFELTPEMGRALAPALELYDTYEDDPIEVIEIAVREELGLAHTLNYNVETDLPLPKGMIRQFARANKSWEPGFVNPNAWQFQNCEELMRREENLRDDAWGHEAMIDGSRIYEPKPWAIPYILKFWDRNIPFHSFLGSVSECSADAQISVHDLEPDEAKNMSRVATKLRGQIISSDELEAMQVVIELAADREMPAEEILEFFSEN